jgi:DNA-binding protein YbaB
MMDMMKNAAEIKKKADALNQEVQRTTITETDSTGQVRVTVNGMGGPIKYEISPDLLKKVKNYIK